MMSSPLVRCEEGASEQPVAPSDPAHDWILYLEAYAALSPEMQPGEVLVPLDILDKSEIGDHFETINPDRLDMHNAFGNPDAHMFHTVQGNDKPEGEQGTYGERNGGGRRLMVTEASAKFSVAVMDFMHAARNIYVEPSEPQSTEILKTIPALGSDDFQERENAAKKIESIGRIAEPVLEQALKNSKDPEVVSRIQELLKSLKGTRELTAKAKTQLKDILLRFRTERPAAQATLSRGRTAVGDSISGVTPKK